MSRPFCEVRCTFVRCLFVGSTYIWQYSSRSLLYVVFGTLALGISESLHAEGLKISVDVFFFSTSANQIAYLSKASSETLQTCSQTCLSRGFFVGLQTTVACFLSFFFFLRTFDSKFEAVCMWESLRLVSCTALEKWIWEERLESFWIGLAACGHFKRTLLKAHF